MFARYCNTIRKTTLSNPFRNPVSGVGRKEETEKMENKEKTENVEDTKMTEKVRLLPAFSPKNSAHDEQVHLPLIRGSHFFSTHLLDYLCPSMDLERPVKIFIDARPNSLPHIGDMFNISTAFAVAHELRQRNNKATVNLDFADPVPSSTRVYRGIPYHRIPRSTLRYTKPVANFNDMMERLSKCSGVPYVIRHQQDIMKGDEVRAALQEIIKDRNWLGPALEPQYQCLGLTRVCPTPECRWTETHGVRNEYKGDEMTLYCHMHGPHEFNVATDDLQQIGFNTRLRHQFRRMLFARDSEYTCIEAVGGDLAGSYMEQMIRRPLSGEHTPLMFYTPQILDWTGAKISQNLFSDPRTATYIKRAGLGYLFSYRSFVRSGHDLKGVYDLCLDWVKEPNKLFRNYTIAWVHEYLNELKARQVKTL